MNVEFENFLKEAGIKIPTIGRFFFEWRWKAVEEEFFRYRRELEEKRNSMKKYEDDIIERFGADTKVKEAFVGDQAKFVFKSPKSAKKQLKEEMEIIECFDPYEWFLLEAQKLQEEWLYKLIAQAKKEGEWLVIKRIGYQPYHRQNEETFNKDVKDRKFAVIRAIFMGIVWVAFDPTNSKDVEAVKRGLGVYPTNAEITFLK